MEFIAMDLIEEFHPLSSKGNRYALMAVCMLTGFTFCIPIKSKKAEDVMKAYTDNICCVFGPSKKILTENGTEFKNKLWTDVFKRMCTEHRTSPIYSPQCNGRIEGFHKKTIQRHCNACSTCAKHNIKVQQIQKEHFKVPPQPMEFIAMDLIEEFHPLSSKGNRYALMAVCMLTGFTFCIIESNHGIPTSERTQMG